MPCFVRNAVLTIAVSSDVAALCQVDGLSIPYLLRGGYRASTSSLKSSPSVSRDCSAHLRFSDEEAELWRAESSGLEPRRSSPSEPAASKSVLPDSLLFALRDVAAEGVASGAAVERAVLTKEDRSNCPLDASWRDSTGLYLPSGASFKRSGVGREAARFSAMYNLRRLNNAGPGNSLPFASFRCVCGSRQTRSIPGSVDQTCPSRGTAPQAREKMTAISRPTSFSTASWQATWKMRFTVVVRTTRAGSEASSGTRLIGKIKRDAFIWLRFLRIALFTRSNSGYRIFEELLSSQKARNASEMTALSKSFD